MKTINRVFIYVSLVSAVLILLAFSIFISNTNKFFSAYYNEQLNNYSSIFKKAIEMADNYTQIYERAVADDLYRRLSTMNQELKNTALEQIDAQTLEALRGGYSLQDLSVFAKDADGIYIYSSTIPAEIGERTKDWGYWDDAFESLFEGKEPSTEKGLSFENYWIGPRSKSHYLPGYYRYAYYYNAAQNYLINGALEDSNDYGDNIVNMLDDIFDHLSKEISYIEAVSPDFYS